MTLGPLDLPGGPFLALYIILLVGTLAVGLLVPGLIRPAGQPQAVADADKLALLAGGRARFGEAVIARLLAVGALAMEGTHRLRVIAADRGASPAGKAVLALPSPIKWREVQSVLDPHVRSLVRRMVASGLLMSEEERARVRIFAVLPYFLLLAFGAAKWTVGLMRDRPVGYLSALLLLTTTAALVRWFRIDPRTRAGVEAVATARMRGVRLRMAPTDREIGTAVALFGTPVLTASGWADFHRMRQGSAGGGETGVGCGDGGGGGCGGGCGGCGGG